MFRVVQVRIREAGRIHYFKIGDMKVDLGSYCIVETDRGHEYGQIVSDPKTVLDAEAEEPIKRMVRKATIQDIERINRNKIEAKKAFGTCLEKVESHKLPMKLVFVEYSFDKHKLIFYFTADGRIDFRDLVKDLASIFKARIELRQIGVRDEAKILGGIGGCGRTLCCASFLKDFEPVNIKMAKTQQLSLNPDKISGVCGRLLCCLKYENCVYEKYLKNMPQEGARVVTEHGEGWVKNINILKQEVVLVLEDNREITVQVSKLTVKDKGVASEKLYDKEKNKADE